MSKTQVVSLIMRVVLGILFLAHGINKFHMGIGNVAGWFHSLGIPEFMAYVVAVLELIGGILLIAGLFTRYVSALFVVMLIGAVITVKSSAGLLGNPQMPGYELDLGFILISLYLIVAERSKVSIDHIFMKNSKI